MKKKNDTGSTDEPTKTGPKGGQKGDKQKQDKVRKTGSGILNFALPGLGATALVILIMSLVLAWLQFGRHQELNERRLANALAQSQTSLLELSLNHAQGRLKRVAKSAWVGQALEKGEVRQAEERLTALVPGRVHVLPDTLSLSERDLSFTARDLVKKARDGETPEPVLLPGDPPRLLHARAAAQGPGAVLMRASLAQLQARLKEQNLEQANSQIKQEGGSEIFARGNGHDGVDVSTEAPFNVRVRLTLPSSSQDPAMLLLFALIALGGLVVALLLQAFIFRAVAQAIRKDGAILSNLAQELARDTNALPRGDFSFLPLRLVTTNMQKLAQKSATRKEAPSASPGSSTAQHSPGTQLGEESASETAAPSRGQGVALPEAIFRAYDIRGRTDGELSEENVRLIGRAIGSEAIERGQESILVARDGRNSSPELQDALVTGLTSTGIDVIKIGAVPTPLLYYAVGVLNTSNGVCLTGSHNPPEYNGVKVVLEGASLHGEQITQLRERIAQDNLTQGQGGVSETDISSHYLGAIHDDIVLARPLHVVIDCGNGITGQLAPELFDGLGCTVTRLYDEVDGNFPNHGPDPGEPANLEALVDKVKETSADLGLAFDGDGDRLGMVTDRGEIIWPDRLMMLYARDLLSRSPGADIIFDVKSSRELSRLISQQGGRPLMWKTGHSLLHAKRQETGAPLAGEMSGHIFFGDRWTGFDDALYAAARLLEILSLESDDTHTLFQQLQTGVTTPEIPVPVADERKFRIIEQLVATAGETEEGSVFTLDGLRVDFEDGWGLVRASNTQPRLVARFEGRDQAALERIQKLFHAWMADVDSSINLPF